MFLQIQFLSDPSALHLKLESPPLTPPREASDVSSPLSPSITPVIAIKPAPAKSKGHRSRPPIAPKIEPRNQPATITVKQIPGEY